MVMEYVLPKCKSYIAEDGVSVSFSIMYGLQPTDFLEDSS